MNSSDYVIVGAGSAGCVVAARLSEDPSCEVTLLEAGDEDRSSDVHQPNRWPVLWDRAEGWGYATTLQPGYNLRSIPCPRGKVLGGTSSINAMIYIRGDRRDFDNWRDLGNEGWGWEDVLPYFLKSEDQARGASALHGVGGPLSVSDLISPDARSLAFVEAAVRCGFRRNSDFNGERREGAGLYQVTMRDGKRCSTADAFLRPAMGRSSLRVVTRARVLRVVIDGDRARAVEYFDGSQVLHVHARREVILCAGAIDSPRLLMLSGIGDPAQLEALGIKVNVPLPGVGANLTDHPGTSLAFGLRLPGTSRPTTNHAEGGLFMKSSTLESGFEADLQFFAVPFAPFLIAATTQSQMMGIAAQACRPRSRGRVALRSADPADAPLIDPAYLTHREDLLLQMEGVRTIRRIAASAPLNEHIAAEVVPGAQVTEDTALEVAIRATSGCIWHPVGTCRMGTENDAVVDAQLRVRGTRSLRVVDASVMPQITSGNTNAPTIMIAEKAADMIRTR